MRARLRWVLAIGMLVCCRREGDGPTATPDDGTSGGVPDEAVATIDGQSISRDAFDEALVATVASGPASRDDRGLRQRLLLALVTRELVRRELAASGKDDGELTRQAVEVEATIARLERYRPADAKPPGWVAQPPLEQADVARAAVLAVQQGAFDIGDAEVVAEYERHKAEWTSEHPWFHVVRLTVRYDDAIGVPECDDYLAKARRCTAKFPASTQPAMIADLERNAAQWRSEAADADRRAELASRCSSLATTTREETSSMECDWLSAVAPGDPSGPRARRKVASARAKELRAKLAAGVEPATIAAELGHAGDGDVVVHAGELAKPVAKAVGKLKPGALAKQAIDDGAAFVIVKLVERWPAGTIPLQARRAEFEDRARVRKFDDAFARLPRTLVDRHEVAIHPTFDPLFGEPK